MRTFLAVGERGPRAAYTLSSRAPKSIATFAGLWIMRYPGDEERAALNVLTPAASGSGPIQERTDAYVTRPINNVEAQRGVRSNHGRRATYITVPGREPGRLITQEPLGGAIELGQVENRTNRMAGESRGVIRTVQFASRVLAGAEGMDSTCVRRQWDERQSELTQLDDFRLDGRPEAA